MYASFKLTCLCWRYTAHICNTLVWFALQGDRSSDLRHDDLSIRGKDAAFCLTGERWGVGRGTVVKQNAPFLYRMDTWSNPRPETRSSILPSSQQCNQVTDKIEASHVWGTVAYWTDHHLWVPLVGPVKQQDVETDNSNTLCWHLNFVFFALWSILVQPKRTGLGPYV